MILAIQNDTKYDLNFKLTLKEAKNIKVSKFLKSKFIVYPVESEGTSVIDVKVMSGGNYGYIFC